MTRNEKTTVEKLAPGDRFYFCSDKNKLVWEVAEHKRHKFKYGVLSTIITRGKDRNHIKLGREVIFLRNANEPNSQP